MRHVGATEKCEIYPRFVLLQCSCTTHWRSIYQQRTPQGQKTPHTPYQVIGIIVPRGIQGPRSKNGRKGGLKKQGDLQLQRSRRHIPDLGLSHQTSLI